MNRKRCFVTVEYMAQDGKVKTMVSKPLTKQKANREVARLSLTNHKVDISYGTR